MSSPPFRVVPFMTPRTFSDLQAQLEALERALPDRVSRIVDTVLTEAVRRAASDIHLEPTHQAVEVRYRLDGVLQRVASLPRDLAPNLVARLKVLAELLTYRLDVPQEGRLADAISRYGVDMRVSTYPTIHGERAVVRLFDVSGRILDLGQLGLPADLHDALVGMLRERSGAILLTGPSGSGKTTTIYACLRHLVQASQGGCHIVTIEDPVEQVLEGVSQSQARPGSEFDFARGLRGLLRQDPEVIMIGEIRDPETAGIAVEAALTGHLVFSTVHAGSACGVINRLLEMGIEPYLLTSSLRGVLNQRLVRRLCEGCSGSAVVAAASRAASVVARLSESGAADCHTRLGESGYDLVRPAGCEQCAGTGYHGRLLLAELLTVDAPLRQAILARADTTALEAAAHRPQRQTMRQAAERAVADGLTTGPEIERVLGRQGI
jgi:type II secretory ATPase GspE/PulE/Tfp pilus assembly ATPase PilB-like protein